MRYTLPKRSDLVAAQSSSVPTSPLPWIGDLPVTDQFSAWKSGAVYLPIGKFLRQAIG